MGLDRRRWQAGWCGPNSGKAGLCFTREARQKPGVVSAEGVKGGLGLPLCLGIFCAMGIVQLWIMVSAVSSWIGSIVLGLSWSGSIKFDTSLEYLSDYVDKWFPDLEENEREKWIENHWKDDS